MHVYGVCVLQVKAAGVNRLDLLQAAGRYPPPPGDSEILGVEGKTLLITIIAHVHYCLCMNLLPCSILMK